MTIVRQDKHDHLQEHRVDLSQIPVEETMKNGVWVECAKSHQNGIVRVITYFFQSLLKTSLPTLVSNLLPNQRKSSANRPQQFSILPWRIHLALPHADVFTVKKLLELSPPQCAHRRKT